MIRIRLARIFYLKAPHMIGYNNRLYPKRKLKSCYNQFDRLIYLLRLKIVTSYIDKIERVIYSYSHKKFNYIIFILLLNNSKLKIKIKSNYVIISY